MADQDPRERTGSAQEPAPAANKAAPKRRAPRSAPKRSAPAAPPPPQVSVILPCLNEASGLAQLLPRLTELLPDAEVLVVDDGSSDDSAAVAEAHDVRVVRHPRRLGNGAAIKTGARNARGEVLVFMDADGQHNPADIPRLLRRIDAGYDMAVGARRSDTQASWYRDLGNRFYNWFASYMVNQEISDLTSGFRAVRARYFRDFLHLLPNGFSYPSTITMAMFRAGHAVDYIEINARQRIGTSHINLLRDGFRFLLIISRVGTLYSPLKIFVPVSGGFFLLGMCWYLYTLVSTGRFTNMSGLLFTASVLFFLIGLVSEQITMLLYQAQSRGDSRDT